MYSTNDDEIEDPLKNFQCNFFSFISLYFGWLEAKFRL